MKTDNMIVDKSKAFALKVIARYKKLCDTNREFVMSKQLLKSKTSIGANSKEAEQGQSKADFYAKLYISLKEASETEYWLELLHESGYIGEEEFCSIYQDCQEIIITLCVLSALRGFILLNAEIAKDSVKTTCSTFPNPLCVLSVLSGFIFN